MVGDTVEDLVRGLDALADATPSADVVRGIAVPPGKTVFVFPGQGAQWAGMAVGLLGEPVFAARMAECEAALESHVDWKLTDVLGDADALARVDVVQPASWAVMVSLAALWQSVGVRPGAVVGHSQGRDRRGLVAGALSLEDGARVVALRSRLIAEVLAGKGGMASVALSSAEVTARLDERISVAAVNGPGSVVLSGEPEALDELIATCVAEGIRARRIPVDYASHSAHVEAIEDALLTALAPISPREAAIPLHSSVLGERIDTSTMDAGYWYRNLRQPVLFDTAVRGLAAAGFSTFVEVSAHPVLAAAVEETLDGPVVVGSLRRGEGGRARFLTSLAELWSRGATVEWAGLFPARGASTCPPTPSSANATG